MSFGVDWVCPECDWANLSVRIRCRHCGAPAPGGEAPFAAVPADIRVPFYGASAAVHGLGSATSLIADARTARDLAQACRAVGERPRLEPCPRCDRTVLIGGPAPAAYVARCGRRLAHSDQGRPEGCARQDAR